ncbi:hypothetical protein BJ912DRAFT_848737 [Pholiota molesta]|nr:hypothetical protein BJ912DRAFT_848737 [Pholiota molesta]
MTVLPKPALPTAQLESLKFKANQIIDSIYSLQRTIELGGYANAMPAWPDILSKYNILLSQTHNFSNSLVNPFPTPGTSTRTQQQQQNIYERIALHPSKPMPDAQLDGEVVPLLRNQQTTDVLRMENDTVKRLAEHMNTRGSLGVLGITPPPAPPGGFGVPRKPEYEDVLQECAEIRGAHDRRVERASRAVMMLRDKFDWKQRVEVEVEEPEELDWDPRLGPRPSGASMGEERGAAAPMDDVGMESASEGDDDDEGDDEEEEAADNAENMGSSDEDEFNVEGALFNGVTTSPLDGFSMGTTAPDT